MRGTLLIRGGGYLVGSMVHEVPRTNENMVFPVEVVTVELGAPEVSVEVRYPNFVL